LNFVNQPIEKIAEIYNDCKPLIEQNFEIFRDEGFPNDLYYTIEHHLKNENIT
jgi:regulator of RNase E activity RraB